MKPLALAVLITVSSTAFAQGSGLKAGLWEMKVIQQVMDGRDTNAQMAAAQAQMQQRMASMPPAQRSQMEAMMGNQGTRVCISPAMAAKNKPMVDREGRCEPATVNHSGDKTTFEFSCTSDQGTRVGKGESIVSGDTVTTRVDMTMTDAKGRHTMQSETQMKYLGPDCQGVRPADQLAK